MTSDKPLSFMLLPGGNWRATEVDVETKKGTDVTKDYVCRQVTMVYEDGPHVGCFFGRKMTDAEAREHEVSVAELEATDG